MTKSTHTVDVQAIFDQQKKNRIRVGRQDTQARIEKLKTLRRSILAHQSQIQSALQSDFRKHPGETNLSEIFPVTSEIKHAIEHLEDWMRPKKVSAPLQVVARVHE